MENNINNERFSPIKSLLGLLSFSTIIPVKQYTSIEYMTRLVWCWPFIHLIVCILAAVCGIICADVLHLNPFFTSVIIYAFLMLILSFVTQSFSSIQPATLLSIIAGAMVLAVIIITLMSIATTITVKTSIPEQVLGRIASIIQLCAIVSTPLGQLLYGYFADRFPIFLSFACSSLGLLATYVIMKKTYKKLKREKQKNGY